MNLLTLKQEIETDPIGVGYAQWLPHSPGKVVELLNAQVRTMVRSRFITARGILDKWPTGPNDAAAVMDKLEAAGAAVPALKWAVRFLNTNEGLDIGTQTAQAMIGQLGAGGVLTVEEAQKLAALAIQSASRAEQLFGAGVLVTEQDLILAGVV